MDKKKIAFVGEPCYEVVLYLGQVLAELDYQLTVYDLSPLKDVASIVPNVNYSDGIAEYENVKIVWGDISEIKSQEYSIFYFGYNVDSKLISKCDEVWLFTDSQIQHINALKRVEVGTLPRFLVYYSDFIERAAANLMLHEFEFMRINDDNFVELGEISKEFRFHCIYDNHIKYKNGSKFMLPLIKMLLEVDFSRKEIETAIKGVK